MHPLAAIAAVAFAGAALVGAAPDSATIVNSGSTNMTGYTIDVHADGTAAVSTSTRGGAATSTPKPFTLEATAAKQFFADLAAAKKDGVAIQPCMKSASFGSTTRVTWHDWTSPDLSCPPGNAAAAALVHDVQAIATASGVTSVPRRSLGPVMRMPEPSPSST